MFRCSRTVGHVMLICIRTYLSVPDKHYMQLKGESNRRDTLDQHLGEECRKLQNYIFQIHSCSDPPITLSSTHLCFESGLGVGLGLLKLKSGLGLQQNMMVCSTSISCLLKTSLL